MTQSFPTLHVASAIVGIGLCDMKFSQMHEISEFLLGGPVWTHESADPATRSAIMAEGFRQFPSMPTREEARADWRAAAEKALAAYGETVAVEAGKDARTKGPLSTLKDVMNVPAA